MSHLSICFSCCFCCCIIHLLPLQCLQNLHHTGDSNTEWLRTWGQVTNNLGMLRSLRSIEFGLVPSSVLHAMAEKLTELEVLRAEHISDFCDEQMW